MAEQEVNKEEVNKEEVNKEEVNKEEVNEEEVNEEEVNEEEANGSIVFSLLNNFLQDKNSYEHSEDFDYELVPLYYPSYYGLNNLRIHYYSGFSSQSYPDMLGKFMKKQILVIKKIKLSDPNTDLIGLIIDTNMKKLFLSNTQLEAVVLGRNVLKKDQIQRLISGDTQNQWKASVLINDNSVYLEKDPVHPGGRRSRRVSRRRSVRRKSRRRL